MNETQRPDPQARRDPREPPVEGTIAAAEHTFRELDDALFSAVGKQTAPALQFRAAVFAYFLFVRERGDSLQTQFSSHALAARPELAIRVNQLQANTTAKLAALLLAGAPDNTSMDMEATAHVLSGGARALASWWRTRPDVPIEAIVERMMAVVWHGLEHLAPPPGRPELSVVPPPQVA